MENFQFWSEAKFITQIFAIREDNNHISYEQPKIKWMDASIKGLFGCPAENDSDHFRFTWNPKLQIHNHILEN